MRKIITFSKDRSGATAIEFALLALPFFLLVLAVLEVALLAFVDTSLDSALHKAARDVRTGSATKAAWNLTKFKSEVCNHMMVQFGCDSSLLIKTDVLSDFSGAAMTSPDLSKPLNISENFAPGKANDYMLIQAFLPWNSILGYAGVKTRTLPDGRYVLAASAMFRNEPFE
ncbi:TadE/TadG family type IV pilus assembly protein [Rhizobium halophytocola]|uniref:Flp pilus assembly pilin Flp n=1 Tax=Rhizobium halophytocola TaxID=735519 RepID=A0ABS4DYH4_9HYPH|nr:TadE/TadG family type IV pilus assembly protein [Rhizobium halophytocola]MBP1850740.1 Flp pilus assembly pilin Flp [Rhizobium halophytocola]